MANVFLNLPAPAGNGTGAAVDTSTLGKDRTITVQDAFRGAVNIQFSNDSVAGPWATVATFNEGGKKTIPLAGQFMRVERVGVPDTNPGLPVVEVASSDIGGLYLNLPAPAADGVGAAADVSLLGTFNTVTCLDAFKGSVIIEISEDNVTWAQAMVFTAPGWQSKNFVAQYMRVRRSGVPSIAPGLPNVDVGAINDQGSGGSGSNSFVSGLNADRNPATGQEGPEFFTSVGITLNEMRAIIQGGTTPSVDWTVRFGTNRNGTGSTEVVTGGRVSTNVSTGDAVTTFDNGVIPANVWVWLELTTVVGAPVTFSVTLLGDFVP